MKKAIHLENKQIQFKTSQPQTLRIRKIDPKQAKEILQEYFLIDNLSTISINQVGESIQNNLALLPEIISKIITNNNWQCIFNRIKYLTKFSRFDQQEIITDSLRRSQYTNLILRQMILYLDNIKFAEIVCNFKEFKLEDELSSEIIQSLVKDSNTLMKLRNHKSIFDKLVQIIRSKLTIKFEIDKKNVVQFLIWMQFDDETNLKYLNLILNELFQQQQYNMIEQLIKQAYQFQESNIITISIYFNKQLVQNIITDQLKDKKLIYQIAKYLVDFGLTEFLQKQILPKISTQIDFQSFLLKLNCQKWINCNQTLSLQEFNDSLLTLKIFNQTMICSNYYWNLGVVQIDQDIQNQLKDIPILKDILTNYNNIKREPHQQLILIHVIFQVQYKQLILFLTPFEYVVLNQFKCQDQIKYQANDQIQRLIRLEVISQKGSDLIINEQNISKLSTFQLLEEPKQEALQKIQEEQYEQNRRLIIQARITKTLKEVKKIEISQISIKLNLQLKKMLRQITDGEIREAIKVLIEKEILLCENDLLFYNI